MDLQLSHRCCDCQAPGASVVSTLWNSSLNQIVAGGSDGARVLYSPELSTKGFEPAVKLTENERCALCRGNAVCRSEGSSCEHTGSSLGSNDLQSTCTPVVSSQSYVCLFDGVQCPRLFTYYLLLGSLVRYQRQGGKRKRESIRHTLETKKPPMPTTEQHSSSMYHSFMMQGLVSKDNRTQDPREVYLQKSDKQNTSGAVDNPWFKKGNKDYVSHVYEKNQPNTILEEEPEEQD